MRSHPAGGTYLGFAFVAGLRILAGMFHATMRCHLWDLVDEGIDEVLDRLKGEAGITGISVPLACPPVEQLRPHKGVTPRTFRSRGGVQFQPRAEFYANTRLRPVVAEWLRKSNPLPQVAEACAKRGLTLRGEMNCCHAPVMVEKYPFAAVKDVFGEVNPEWMCLGNNDVAEFLCALIDDLSSLGFMRDLQIEALRFPPKVFSGLFLTGSTPETDAGQKVLMTDRLTGLTPQSPAYDDIDVLIRGCERTLELADHVLNGDVAGWLLSLCFCESCRQAATRDGIIIAESQRLALRILEQAFQTGEAPVETTTKFCATHDSFARFIEWRALRSSDVLKAIKMRCSLPMIGCSERYPDTVDPLSTGAQMDGVIRHVRARPRTAGVCIRQSRLHVEDRIPIYMLFDMVGCFSPKDSSELVRTLSEVVQEGAVEAVFDEFGSMPLARLDWIRQAVRKAQRDAD